MSILVVNRRKNADIVGLINLPKNDFVIKEGNSTLSIANYLRRHPLTESFSVNIDVQNQVPTTDDVTFDFVGFTLTTQQEIDTIQVIESFRDKDSFTVIEALNIYNQEVIDDALEQIGDFFDEDNIDDLILPDFCAMRDILALEYNSTGWVNLNVGEKRILIVDWMIPTEDEKKEIFPGGAKRESIDKLFASKMSNLKPLEFTRELSEIADNFDGEIFNKLFKKVTVPSNYKPEVFISRSNVASNDANLLEVDIPVFSNLRTESPLITINSDIEAEFTRDAEVDIQFSCQINANGSTNHMVRCCVNGDDVDNNMRRNGRGSDTSTHPPIRFSFSKGDLLSIKLSNVNSGNGSIIAAIGRSLIRIDEII